MDPMPPDELEGRLAAGAITRRAFERTLAAAGVAVAPLLARTALAAGPLQVFTWAGYDDPGLRPGFDDRFGRAPDFLFYADNDEALAKARAGYRPSLAQPTVHAVGRWREAGLLEPIDVARLANRGDLFPKLAGIGALERDGSVYGVPFCWGTGSVLYRRDLAPEYVGDDTWAILWDEAYAGRLAQRDSMDAAVLQAALILGIDDPYRMSDGDLDRVRAKLEEQRPLLRRYWTSQSDVVDGVASGELVAAYAWNHARAAFGREGIDVGYMVPREGVPTWVDCLCLIDGGPGDEEEAYAYIDAAISAEAGVFLVEEYGYGPANARAFDRVDPARLAELGMDDPARIVERAAIFAEWDPEVREKALLMFEEIKAGL